MREDFIRNYQRHCLALISFSVSGMLAASLALADDELIKVFPLGQGPSAPAKLETGPSAAGTAKSETAELAGRLREAIAAKSDSSRAPSIPSPSTLSQTQAAQQLIRETGGAAKVLGLKETGLPQHIKGAILEPAASSSGTEEDRDQLTAQNFLFNQQNLLGLKHPASELRLKRYVKDELGRRHLRYDQVFEGIPIWPTEVIVHLDAAGNVDAFDGGHVRTPKKPVLKPALDASEAVERARKEVRGGDGAQIEEPELILYAADNSEPALAWKIQLRVSAAHDWLVIVSAVNGGILRSNNQVNDAGVTGSGIDLLGISRNLNVWEAGGTYYMENTAKPMFELAQPKDPLSQPAAGVIHILDARNQPPTSNPPPGQDASNFSFVESKNPNRGWLADAVSAAYNISETYDYFLAKHNRNSLDGNGGVITGVVRYANGFQNAFWSHKYHQMFFGTGDVYAASLDVVGHELTHAVVEFSANFISGNQTGALNEALADIFGESVEGYSRGNRDWILGTDLRDPIRNMRDPSQSDFPQPTRMSEYVRTTDDNGGVHINNGIINRAFYLLSEGLSGAIGSSEAERIFYRALTVHLRSNATFTSMRNAAVRSAEELFGQGSSQAQRTAQAFDAVEIFEGADPPDVPKTPAGGGQDSSLFLYYDQGREDWFLARKELAQNDSDGGSYLSRIPSSPKAPSVSADGVLAVYVSADYNICLITPDTPYSDTCLGFRGQVASVAMSADAKRYAFVFRNARTGETDNQIAIIDLGSNADPKVYSLQAPVTDGPALEIDHADAMDFTADGRYLIFDALNSYTVGRTKHDRWSIYALDLVSGVFSSLVSSNRSNIDIGNPSTARTRGDLITFDVVNKNTNPSQSGVHVVNIFNGSQSSFNSVNKGWYALPHFTVDDRNIQYSLPDDSAYSDAAIAKQPLAEDNLTPSGAAELWIADGDYSATYRRPSAAGQPGGAQWSLTVVNTARSLGDATVISDPPGINCQLQTKPAPTQIGSCQGSFPANSNVTLSIDPTSGLMFDGDPSGCDDGGNKSSCIATLRSEAVQASMGLVPSPKTLNVGRLGEGRVSGGGIHCGSRCAKQYPKVKRIRLRAAPKPGWRLDAWQGCDSASGKICVVRVHSPRAVQALFGRKIR